ncbi:hypothetical protein ACI79D_13400 [Geodermatophilus sp. SYSU D00708]
MSAVRRTVVLLVLTVAVVVGASLPAQALFADTTAVTTALGTRTVQPPTSVRVDTDCTTTTTVIKRYYRVTSTGTTMYAWNQTSTTATAKSNVQSDTTTPPTWTSATEYNTTQTIKDTELYATGRWKGSTSPGVTGYRMAAIMANGASYPLDDVGPTATTMVGHYDADVVDLGARLAMVTLTSYGWTANSQLSNVVTC